MNTNIQQFWTSRITRSQIGTHLHNLEESLAAEYVGYEDNKRITVP